MNVPRDDEKLAGKVRYMYIIRSGQELNPDPVYPLMTEYRLVSPTFTHLATLSLETACRVTFKTEVCAYLAQIPDGTVSLSDKNKGYSTFLSAQ